jgi:hypothetical protein
MSVRCRLCLTGFFALVLWALFLPVADPWEGSLAVDFRPPAMAIVLLAAIALAGLARWRLGRALRIAVAALVLAAALLQFAAALVQRFLDRGLDLYFDLAQLPSLFGLFTDALGPWRATLALSAAVLVASVLLAVLAWSIGAWQKSLSPRACAVALILALAALASGELAFAAPQEIAEQAGRLTRAWAVMAGFDHRYDAALASPAPPEGDLALLKKHDVFLIYVESYGTVVFDEPRYRSTLAPALEKFGASVQAAGYHVASSRLVSPTFGGGSWLAHGTLASGLKLDPFLYRLLTEGNRKNLARYLHDAGHRTVAVMPGIKKPWPEGAFWGFERSYYAADLAYRGPGFGWFDIPDQYTLARFAAAELGPGHAPLFAELVLVSSHTPFTPVPPYVADWTDAGTFGGVRASELSDSRPPDWSHLETPYLQALAYDLETLGAFLARLPGDPLVIILGDHQPPGLAAGAKSPWTVPVHVLARDPALLEPFRRLGYVDGLFPPPQTFKGMESFLGDFLAGFSAEAG